MSRLAIDWTACRARGVCSELLPERIVLDEWGYPLLDPTPVPMSSEAFVRQAVNACPTRALRLQRTPANTAPADAVTTGPTRHPATAKRERRRP